MYSHNRERQGIARTFNLNPLLRIISGDICNDNNISYEVDQQI